MAWKCIHCRAWNSECRIRDNGDDRRCKGRRAMDERLALGADALEAMADTSPNDSPIAGTIESQKKSGRSDACDVIPGPNGRWRSAVAQDTHTASSVESGP